MADVTLNEERRRMIETINNVAYLVINCEKCNDT